jgi:hypothetical protein
MAMETFTPYRFNCSPALDSIGLIRFRQIDGVLLLLCSESDTKPLIWDAYGHMNTACSNTVHSYMITIFIGWFIQPKRSTRMYAIPSLVFTTSGDNGCILTISRIEGCDIHTYFITTLLNMCGVRGRVRI